MRCLSAHSTWRPVVAARLGNKRRRGAVLVLTAALVVVLLGFVALAVDVGYLLVVRTELQRSADAAALAAASQLASEDAPWLLEPRVRQTALRYAALNNVCRSAPVVDRNTSNLANGDLVIGTIDFSDPDAPMTLGLPETNNAVKVRIRRSAALNGEVPLYFARVFSHSSAAINTEATAAIVREVGGFRSPENGERLSILPITLDVDTWKHLMDGEIGDDIWTWESSEKTVSSGADGIPEVVIYPEDIASSGNCGTVNIGTSSNSTSHLSDQIQNGLSQSDLDYHGGELSLGEDGQLTLTGDTGISAGIKDELAAISGQKRIIPLYEDVSGPGNNAQYTIVGWAGIRIIQVNLTGGKKALSVQPAIVVTDGAIPAQQNGQSTFVYSQSILVR